MTLKKLFSCFLVGTLTLSSVLIPVPSSVVYAEETTESAASDSLTTEKDQTTVKLTTEKDGSVTLSNYSGSAEKLDLQELFPDAKILKIASSAFSGNKYLTEIVIPSSVVIIDSSAFSSCTNLKKVTFSGRKEEQHLKSIGSSAFFRAGIQNITLPDTVTTIGESAFSGSSLQSITLPESLTVIGNKAFAKSALRSITIPASCTDICSGSSWIGEGAFVDCSALEEVIFADRTENITIGIGAFEGCDKLASVQLPEQLTSIASHTFQYTGLTEITIPAGVTSIDRLAFGQNSLLQKVIFKSPDTVIAEGNSLNPTISSDMSNWFICCDLKADGSRSNAEVYARANNIRFVRPTKSLSIESMPRTELFYGDKIDITSLQEEGLVVHAEYDSSVAPTSGSVPLTDCIVSGYDPEQVGEQQVRITYGESSVSYTVNVYYNMALTDIKPDKVYTYTGKAVEPEFNVEYGKRTLQKDKDYEVTCSGDFTNAGIITATFTGKGNYSGTVTKNFYIGQKNLGDNDIKVSVEDTVYNTKQQKPVPIVTYGDLTLKEGVDYDVTYENNKHAGSSEGALTITAKADSNFEGEKTVYFDILPKDISELTISEIQQVVYDGKEQRPNVSISWNGDNELTKDDYEVSYSRNVNASTSASITITGIGDYTGEIEKKFTIIPANISKVVLTKTANYYFDEDDVIAEDSTLTYSYTGREIVPQFGVYYKKRQLEEGKDYNITVENNINPGTATLTITGINNFTGSRSVNFLIFSNSANPVITQAPSSTSEPVVTETPLSTSKPVATETPLSTSKPVATETPITVKAKKVSLTSCVNKKTKKIVTKWKKQEGVSGYEISIATNKKFTNGKTIKRTTKTSYTFSKLKKGKTYYIRVRAYVIDNKKKNYGTYSTVKKVTVKK